MVATAANSRPLIISSLLLVSGIQEPPNTTQTKTATTTVTTTTTTATTAEVDAWVALMRTVMTGTDCLTYPLSHTG